MTETNSNGALLYSYSYKYDGNRNITDITANNTTNSYQYDELNRIRTSTQFQETYSYDNRGNRSGMTTSRPFERPDAQTTFDKRDRLTSVVTTTGANVSYRYNGDGQLWERTENGQTTRYYWDGDQIIAEATVTGGTAVFKARYVRGRGLIAREDSQGKAYYVHNGHGDVTDLMDADGITKLNTYSYDVFGNIASMNETVAQPFKYSGEMQDTTTGLQYLRARWYDPSVGRFVNEDTYEGELTNPLTLNLYTYVSNNPLIYTDPTGHFMHGDNVLSVEDRSRIAQISFMFNTAKANHDIAGMQSAHDAANAIRFESGMFELLEYTNYSTGKTTIIDGSVGGVTDPLSFMESGPFQAGSMVLGLASGAGEVRGVIRLGEEGIEYAVSNAQRMQHAFKHAKDLGFGNWNKTVAAEWSTYVSDVLRTAEKSFDNVLGGTAVKGFYKQVNGQAVAVYVYAEGQFQGFVATVVNLSEQQLSKFGLK